MMPKSHTTNSRSKDQGVVALELVLVLPFLVALLLAIAQVGSFFNKKIEVTSAARDAARTLALRGQPSYPFGMTASDVFTCAAGDTTSNASVTLTSSFTFSIPFIPIGTNTITAKGTMRCGG